MDKGELPNEEEIMRELFDNNKASIRFAGIVALGSIAELASYIIDNKIGVGFSLGMIAIGSVGFVKSIIKHSSINEKNK